MTMKLDTEFAALAKKLKARAACGVSTRVCPRPRLIALRCAGESLMR